MGVGYGRRLFIAGYELNFQVWIKLLIAAI